MTRAVRSMVKYIYSEIMGRCVFSSHYEKCSKAKLSYKYPDKSVYISCITHFFEAHSKDFKIQRLKIVATNVTKKEFETLKMKFLLGLE